MKRILPTESKQASQLLKNHCQHVGVKFYEGIKLSENDINVNEDGVTFEISSDIIKVDKVLLSIGRKPNTSDIGLNNTKIKLFNIRTYFNNEFQQTEDKTYLCSW